MSTPDHAERFWAKVRKSAGCWTWSGACNRAGYGQFKLSGRQLGAHRVAWELENGPIPEGMSVLHRCDNPPCVRHDHLFIGSAQDNMTDKARKGRTYRGGPTAPATGEQNGNSKLMEKDAQHIRALYVRGGRGTTRSGPTQKELAQRFGITQTVVSKILRGELWA